MCQNNLQLVHIMTNVCISVAVRQMRLVSQNSLLLVLVFVYDNNIKELFQPYHLRLKSCSYYPTVIYGPFTF